MILLVLIIISCNNENISKNVLKVNEQLSINDFQVIDRYVSFDKLEKIKLFEHPTNNTCLHIRDIISIEKGDIFGYTSPIFDNGKINQNDTIVFKYIIDYINNRTEKLLTDSVHDLYFNKLDNSMYFLSDQELFKCNLETKEISKFNIGKIFNNPESVTITKNLNHIFGHMYFIGLNDYGNSNQRFLFNLDNKNIQLDLPPNNASVIKSYDSIVFINEDINKKFLPESIQIFNIEDKKLYNLFFEDNFEDMNINYYLDSINSDLYFILSPNKNVANYKDYYNHIYKFKYK